MVCPSVKFENVGATVTLAVIVVVNTFDSAQLIAIAAAEKATTTGGVAALPLAVNVVNATGPELLAIFFTVNQRDACGVSAWKSQSAHSKCVPP